MTSVFAISAIVSHGSLNTVKGLTEAQRGLVFSGLGVWVLIVFHAQGYWISRPLPAAELMEWLTASMWGMKR